MSDPAVSGSPDGQEVAVVGMAGRFPGARDLDEFWRNLRDGVQAVSRLTGEELSAAGVPRRVFRDPDYVSAVGVLRDVELFDAGFFGYSPGEAAILDPQHRIFLECAWEALESSGYTPEHYGGRVGVFAAARMNSYLLNALSRSSLGRAEAMQAFGAGADSTLAMLTSFKLGLEGPSINVQTACSSSLVAVHLGCQSLLSGETDVVLAGGISITVPQAGYLYREGGLLSPTGECRAFDAGARGLVGGSGAGVVVLRRLEDALADGDTVHAVIRGSAVNNSGAGMVDFSTPRKDGQAAVIVEALAVAGVEPETVSYVEAHGTGTDMGDAVEVAALSKAFGGRTDRVGFCALGSVKPAIGHTWAASGVVGLIKTVLSLKNGQIPPSLHFERPNPKIDFDASPFFVNTALREWSRNGNPRRAGVSSFGSGGTNAHVVLEEAPPTPGSAPSRPWQLLVLSARSPSALEAATDRLARHLRSHPEQQIADVAHTLRVGRQRFAHRRVVVCRGRTEVISALEARDPRFVQDTVQGREERPLAFLFPGPGDHSPRVARGLYKTEPAFREELDRCAELLLPLVGKDVREVIFPAEPAEPENPGEPAGGSMELRQMADRELAHPALFALEYALAKTWMEWGVTPEVMIGHSLGEYVAATVAGVFRLEDALRLVVERDRALQGLAAGAMLAASLDADEILPLLRGGLALAAVDAPGMCRVGGPAGLVAELEAELVGRGIACRRLDASHALHTPMMEPAAERLTAVLRRMRLRAPEIPLVSSVTGRRITTAEATDPEYWARHLCRTVRFGEGVRRLLDDPGRLFLEVGPGCTLGELALRSGASGESVLASLQHDCTGRHGQAVLLDVLGRLWMAGLRVRWSAFSGDERRMRVPLPTYPFERQRCWVEPTGRRTSRPHAAGEGVGLYVPRWRRSPMAPCGKGADVPAGDWLILLDGLGVGERLACAASARGSRVATAVPGERFRRLGEGSYELRPGAPDDFAALADALAASGSAPRHVAHLWTLGVDGGDGAGSFARAQELGYTSLVHLAGALQGTEWNEVRIQVVSDGLFNVAGGEAVSPAKATLLGPCRTIPRENAGLACRVIDVARPAAGEAAGAEIASRILAEAAATDSEAVVAYRGWQRWSLGIKEVRSRRPTAPAGAGTYLVTGAAGAELVTAIEKMARIGGGSVVSLDDALDDAGRLERTIRVARSSSGPLRGLVHVLGVEAPGEDPDVTFERIARELSVLDAALREEAPGFVLLALPLASFAGEPGGAAASAVDALAAAFAERRRLAGFPWSCLRLGADIRDADGADTLARVPELRGESQIMLAAGTSGLRCGPGGPGKRRKGRR